MPGYRIVHRTTYRFAEPVTQCVCATRLIVRETPQQRSEFAQIVTRPLEARRTKDIDAYGNVVTTLEFIGPLETLELSACNVVHTRSRPAIDASMTWESARDALTSGAEAAAFRQTTPLTEVSSGLVAYVTESFPPGRPLIEGLRDWSSRLHRDIAYATDATSTTTTAADVLRLRRGVCQDFAHVGVAGLRALGLAARYVAGYADVLGGEPRIGRHQAHAWFSVDVPGHGWTDFDPTCGYEVDERYVTLAWGRDYDDVTPIRGEISGGAAQRFDVLVSVERL